MAETMKVPGIGQVKKTYVYAGVGVTAGILVYAYWRASQRSAGGGDQAAEEETPVTGTDLPQETDYPYALGPSYDYGAGVSYPSYVAPSTSNPPIYSGVPTSNQEWAQKARESLAEEGVDSGQASSAIGKFLGKLCLSTAEADLIRRALAMQGQPPQSTFSIVTCAATPATPAPTTPVPPKPAPAKVACKPAGLKWTSRGTTWVGLDWNPACHSEGYHVYMGSKVVASPRYSSATVHGLKKNTKYTFAIEAIPDKGYKKGPRATITVTTKK